MSYDAGMLQTLRELGNGLDVTRAYRDDNLLDSVDVATKDDLSFAYGYDANKNLDTEDRGTPGSSADDFSFSSTVDAKDCLTNWLRDNGDSQDWTLLFEGDWGETDGSLGGTAFDQARMHNAAHEIPDIDRGPTPGPRAQAHARWHGADRARIGCADWIARHPGGGVTGAIGWEGLALL